MKITKLFDLYDHYNEKYFKNTLPFVDIVYADLKDAYGYTMTSTASDIVILLAKGMNKKDTITTLVHEMIHVKQAHYDQPMDHGKTFKAVAKKIAKKEGWKRKDI